MTHKKPTPGAPITIVGNLGRDRETRWTNPRTFEARWYDETHDEWRSRETTTRSREYIVVTVAEDLKDGNTGWHRVICWNTSNEAADLRLARCGDQVEITGHREIWTAPGGHVVHQIILDRYRPLRLAGIPEIP